MKVKTTHSISQRKLLRHDYAFDTTYFKESFILKFNGFNMNENNDVISFLYSLKNSDLNGYINDFLTTNRSRKSEYIEDILIEISKKVDKEKYAWVKSELKKI